MYYDNLWESAKKGQVFERAKVPRLLPEESSLPTWAANLRRFVMLRDVFTCFFETRTTWRCWWAGRAPPPSATEGLGSRRSHNLGAAIIFVTFDFLAILSILLLSIVILFYNCPYFFHFDIPKYLIPEVDIVWHRSIPIPCIWMYL